MKRFLHTRRDQGLSPFFWTAALLVSLSCSPGTSAAAQSLNQIKGKPFASAPQTEPQTANTLPLFEKLPSSITDVSFQMQLPEVGLRFRELLQLGALGGICTGDFNRDGFCDFYVTSPLGSGRLFQNLGNFKFKDVTQECGLFAPEFWGTGAAFVDIENDGDLDLITCAYRQPNRLYLNQGSKDGKTTFAEVGASRGLNFNGGSMNLVFADMDLDGDLDAYLATTAVPPPSNVKFRVQFEGKKPVVPEELREYWGLIYLPGDKAHPTENGQYDSLFRNDGGYFTDITKKAGITGPHLTLGAIWWDENSDGFPDLYIANDYMGPDKLYRNQRDGTFVDVAKASLPHTPWSSMGVDVGDLNNDGLPDLIASDMLGTSHYRRQVMQGESSKKVWFLDFAEPRQYSRNAVYLNAGTDRYLEAAYQLGMAATDWTWAPRIEDFDNDGWPDVFFTNGMLRDVQHADLANYADRTFQGGTSEWANFWAQQRIQTETNRAYRNQGELSFVDASQTWGLDQQGVSFGSATADFDNDGDLDLIVNNADAPLAIYRNNSRVTHSLQVRLRGSQSNRDGIGAKITLINQTGTQTRWITHSRAWLSGSQAIAHFGLGSGTSAQALEVNWPSGHSQRFTNLEADHIYTITEPTTKPADTATLEKKNAPQFTPSSHFESMTRPAKFPSDFAFQPLLPSQISKNWIGLAAGDIDGDGNKALYLGGSFGEAGQLVRFSNDQELHSIPLSISPRKKGLADAAAQFVDVDLDGMLDLIVFRAGHPSTQASTKDLHDVYLNRGNRNFELATEPVLPDDLGPVQAVAVADIDQDGDTDLFLAGAYQPGNYPETATSRLLINDAGTFRDHSSSPLSQIGRVRDATWYRESTASPWRLALACDWGPTRLFEFSKNGIWIEKTPPSMSTTLGWWTSIAAADLDRDGDTDFVVGNRGNNTKYQATKSHPQFLFKGDFGTGRNHLIEAYTENGRLLPHRGFEALSSVLPFLRQRFINFHQFSSASLDQMIPADALKQAKRWTTDTSESGIWWNEGNDQFRFTPLPPMAQISPINDLLITHLNSDQHLDLVLATNDFSPTPMTGRFDGGMGLILHGRGNQSFEALRPGDSGIATTGAALKVAQIDLNSDQTSDLVFLNSEGSPQSFVSRPRE